MTVGRHYTYVGRRTRVDLFLSATLPSVKGGLRLADRASDVVRFPDYP